MDDTGGARRDISAFVMEVRGLLGARLLNEVRALGDSEARFIPGLEDVVISLAGLFDDTVASGLDATLGPLRIHTSVVGFEGY